MKTLLTAWLLLYPLFYFSQSLLPAGAQSAGLMNAGMSISSAEGYFMNPGGMLEKEKYSIFLGYQNRFSLRELQTGAMACRILIHRGTISLGYTQNGLKDFQHRRVGVGYALSLFDNFSLGIQINREALILPSFYGRIAKWTGEVGFVLHEEDKWTFSAAIFNLNRAKLSAFQDDRLNSLLRIGGSYKTSSQVELFAEVHKGLENETAILGACAYAIHPSFIIRVGAGVGPVGCSFGFGYRRKSISIDMATQLVQRIGWVPTFSILYAREK